MARKNTIKLLLVNASDNDSERLVSLFRSAGRVARAERVGAAADLEQMLKKPWDLLIADDNHPQLDIETCLQQVRQAAVDVPVIVRRADADLAALFSAGARDVVAPAEEQRLICAALRELDTAELHRSVAALKTQLAEIEERNALLLGTADQAIAYVADGMVINANPLFAERFGCGADNPLDSVPIIDLLAAEDHENFKALLKTGGDATLAFTGLRADGGTFEAALRLHTATYDGEPCTQLVIEQRSAAAGAGSSERDADTGLFARHHLLEQLDKHDRGSLLLIGIDHFAQLRRQLGFVDSSRFTAALAAFIVAQEPPSDHGIARVSDDCLALLAVDTGTESALQWAGKLCRAVEEHIFDLGALSLQCTISVGITAAGAGTPAELLNQALSSCEKVREDNASDGIGNAAAVFVAERSSIAAGNQQYALEDALEEGHFALLFQPIISLRGASGDHYEVLLRVRGDTDALELPDNFLDALGVSADNARLDRWILLEATKRLAANRAQGGDTQLLINLTANALQDEGLAAWLGVALKAAALPPSTLILQLREIDVVNYIKPARTFSEAVHKLGCRFSISGFGRVLDPLKTLKNVPSNFVQIDGNFTRELQSSGQPRALKELVSAAGAQDAQVIVPFVENASVLATLWQVGADFIQGHYLQAPSREMNYEFTDIT
jgi:EAL domain-containing protein (putative c-di-GMP-specific phosphodiesterase class I)/GGDEF domain-containing protein/CheY-like chemotaxis protein